MKRFDILVTAASLACFLSTSAPVHGARRIPGLKRITLATFCTDWTGDGIKDGIVFGINFRDRLDRRIRFRGVPCKLDFALYAMKGPHKRGRLLHRRKGLAFTSHRDLNGLFPRKAWQKIPWKAISAKPSRDPRTGWLEVTVRTPQGRFRAREHHFTVLYPKRAATAASPRLDYLARKAGLPVHKGKVPKLDRVSLYCSASDWTGDGKSDGLIWWLAFQGALGERILFTDVPVEIDVSLHAMRRQNRRGRLVFLKRGVKGSSHRQFSAVAPTEVQRIPWSQVRADKRRDRFGGWLEASVSVGGKRYRAIETLMAVLFPRD